MTRRNSISAEKVRRVCLRHHTYRDRLGKSQISLQVLISERYKDSSQRRAVKGGETNVIVVAIEIVIHMQVKQKNKQPSREVCLDIFRTK